MNIFKYGVNYIIIDEIMVLTKERMTIFLMFEVFKKEIENAESLEEVRDWVSQKLEENKKSVINDFVDSIK